MKYMEHASLSLLYEMFCVSSVAGLHGHRFGCVIVITVYIILFQQYHIFFLNIQNIYLHGQNEEHTNYEYR